MWIIKVLQRFSWIELMILPDIINCYQTCYLFRNTYLIVHPTFSSIDYDIGRFFWATQKSTENVYDFSSKNISSDLDTFYEEKLSTGEAKNSFFPNSCSQVKNSKVDNVICNYFLQLG